MLGKSANAAYKEALHKGTTKLPFTEWLHREKEKSFNAQGEDPNLLLINRSLNDSVHQTIQKVVKQGGLKDSESGKTIFGIHKAVIIGGATIITGAIIFLIIKKVKS